jgi:hypothetical protein
MAYLLLSNAAIMGGILGFVNWSGSLGWIPKTLLSLGAVANAAYGVNLLDLL